MSKSNYLIIGSSGTVGSEIVRLLREADHSVLAATSSKLTVSNDVGLEKVHLDLALQEGISEAFERADKVFLLSPPGYSDMYQLLSPLIRESKRRNLKKVVLMTALGVNTVEDSPFSRLEIELAHSGLPYQVIRPNWFMQNFNTFWIQGIQNHGRILLPAGDALVSFIDARDVAGVAAKLLMEDTFQEKSFDLTGPQAITHTEVANLLSEVLEKPVVYEEVSIESLENSLVHAGVPPDYAKFLSALFNALKAGFNAKVTSDVSRVLGREPISFRQYVQDYQSKF